jgi:acetyltransferase-like isoleucine patch superfamily enzyme
MNRHPLLRVLAIPRHLIRKIELFAIKYSYGDRLALNGVSHISHPLGLQLHDRGNLAVGSGTVIERDGILNVHGFCEIGNDAYISARFLLGCSKLVTIGNNVAIGPNVVIVDTNKVYSNLKIPISEQGGVSKEVRIGDNCWIGANSTILPGTILGKHVIVGAGSVVRGTFPDYVLLAGMPAKIIRNLDS